VTRLLLGLVLFLGMHSIAIVAPAVRDRLAARLGEGPWKALYALVSVLGFVLLVQGFGAARLAPTVLYAPPAALRHLAVLVMLPVFPLAFAAYLPGRIQARLKHPLLLATKTWAFAHLLANGTLADVVLFGGFLAWAVAELIALKRRAPRPLKKAPAGRFNDLIAVLLGLAVYALLIGGLHARLLGVDPLG
jgi:uncharacterized membrane protein